ncbi:aldose 1-epimerase family protein (plasmid) [Aquamicrobium terrae]
MHVLENGFLRVEVAEKGAELQSVRTRADSQEWLWNGDPAWWAGRSPLLFPVVGQNPHGEVTIGGISYPMPAHGFARNSTFRVVDAGTSLIRLELLPDETTLASFPFRFRLGVIYRIDADRLSCRVSVENSGTSDMPFQFGFHPGFRWPLPGAGGEAHHVRLANGGSPQMLRHDVAGLIDEKLLASPFEEGMLAVTPAHFEAGAMVFPEGAGTEITFVGGMSRVEMSTSNLPAFALWQKPGAPFLCVEPWCGMAPFLSQGAALENRSGSVMLAPNARTIFGMNLRFVASA